LKKIGACLAGLVCLILVFSFLTGKTFSERLRETGVKLGEDSVVQTVYPSPVMMLPSFREPKPASLQAITEQVYQPRYAPFPVKGIYVSARTALNTDIMDGLIHLVQDTEINSMVIDIKDVTGTVYLPVNLVPEAGEISAVNTGSSDLPRVIDGLKDKGVYLIARIVVFKDPVLASKKPDLVVTTPTGKVWRDYKGLAWVDPYNKAVWDYNILLARAAVEIGFDEVQFDYVRFPSDGPMKTARYPADSGLSKEANIGEFLIYARKALAGMNIPLSADIFGLVCSAQGGLGIGQNLELASEGVDYLSPMVYPSHYAPGTFGIPDPNKDPYGIVFRSLSDAMDRLQGKNVHLRPWLQDFYQYTPEDIRAQIKAVYDAGAEEWILWNSKCRYTEQGLKREKVLRF